MLIVLLVLIFILIVGIVFYMFLRNKHSVEKLTISDNTPSTFTYDQNNKRYTRKQAPHTYLVSSDCVSTVAVEKPEFRNYDLTFYTVSETDQVGKAITISVFQNKPCFNPTVWKTALSSRVFSERQIYYSTSSLLTPYLTQPQNLLYIEVLGPMTCGTVYAENGLFPPLSGKNIIPCVENKIFYVYASGDIVPFSLYVNNYTSGVTQWFTISRTDGVVYVISNTNTPRLSSNNSISQGSGLTLTNKVLAQSKAIFIGPEIFIPAKADDPENIVTIYNLSTGKPFFFGSIYQALLCTGKPVKLVEIMSKNTGLMIPAEVAVKLKDMVLDYTCMLIGIVGNVSAGFVPCDKNGNFDAASRFVVPNCQVATILDGLGRPFIIVIKPVKGQSIPPSILYTFEPISGLRQTYTFSREIVGSGTDMTVKPATITPKYPDMVNLYRIDSPVRGELTPQYLYIGPSIPGVPIEYPSPTPEPTHPPLPEPVVDPIPADLITLKCQTPIYPPGPFDPKSRKLTDINTKSSAYLNPDTFETSLTNKQIAHMAATENTEGVKLPPRKKSREFRQLVGGDTPEPVLPEVVMDIPPIFSLRAVVPEQIERARDQEKCGACWALSIAGVLGDRVALMNRIKSPYPSALWLISACMDPENNISDMPMCGEPPNGCEGGVVHVCLDYLTNYGFTKLEKCWPYKLILNTRNSDGKGNYKQIPWVGGRYADFSCLGCLKPPPDDPQKVLLPTVKLSIQLVTYFTTSTEWGDFEEEEIRNIQNMIKKEILCRGTVLSSVIITDELEHWLETVGASSTPFFIPTSREAKDLEVHSVCITGWVVVGGTEFWEIRNTYGEEYGDGGYIYIAMSRVDNQDLWIGPDIPYTRNNKYYAARSYCIIPKEIPNLDELIAYGIFESTIVP